MLKMVAHSPEKIVKHAQYFMQNEKSMLLTTWNFLLNHAGRGVSEKV